MRINSMYKELLVIAALSVTPAVLSASPKASQRGRVKSGEGTFAINASNMLQRVQNDALSVRNNADQLRALTDESFEVGWRMDGELLERMRARVNEMDKLLSQLRPIQSRALPWQQEAIERIAPSVVNLTDTTQGAVEALKNNKGHIYLSDLGGLADHMYDEAKLIDQTITNFEKYADARQEAQHLKQELGLRNNS